MNLPLPENQFRQFLCAAKQATYAAGGDSTRVQAVLRGAHQLEYREGALLYRDIYYGGNFFAGQETIHFSAAPFWAMTYAGGINEGVNPQDYPGIYDFLKAALRSIPVEAPYRGPAEFTEGDFKYTNRILGKLTRFSGVEIIQFQQVPVYQLHYSGGQLRD